jgi:hypothetical protein
MWILDKDRVSDKNSKVRDLEANSCELNRDSFPILEKKGLVVNPLRIHCGLNGARERIQCNSAVAFASPPEKKIGGAPLDSTRVQRTQLGCAQVHVGVNSAYYSAKMSFNLKFTEDFEISGPKVKCYHYSIPSLVRTSLVRGPSVVRGLERQNFSSHPLRIASK